MSGIKDANSENMRRNRNSETESQFNRRSPGQRRWWKIPRRYHVAIMCYLAFAIKGWMITNFWTMFVHIFLMRPSEREQHFPKSMNWTVEDLETNLDMNHWGGAVIQIPAAILTLSFSPNKIMLLSVLFLSILHMLTPLIIQGPSGGTVFIAFLQGLAAGPLASACMGIWKEWAPVTERTSLLVLAFSGQMINLYVTFTLSMFLAENVGPFSIYYFAGITGLIWCLLWNTLIYDSPSSDPLITTDELCYLEEKIPSEIKEKVPLKSVPLRSILTSPPVLSLLLVYLAMSFLRKVMLLSGILVNMELILANYDPSMSQWALAINFVVIVPASGCIVDLLMNKYKFQTITMRRVFCCGGFVLHTVFLFLTFIRLEIVSIVCYVFSFVFLSLSLVGFIPNILEISPRYACIIIALCTLISRLSAIVFDFIVEAVQGEDKSIEHGSWRQVMIPSGIVALITAAVFAFFSSSNEQPWSQTLLPSRSEPNGSRCYPKSEVEDDTLVSEAL